MADETLKCSKCGNAEHVTQLRHVLVTVGWKATQLYAVSPCKMCTKCGNTSVTLEANIGDLAGLVPDPDGKPAPSNVTKGGKKKAGKAAKRKAKASKSKK